VAKVDQQKAAVARAELDLERATDQGAQRRHRQPQVGRAGQVIQAGQPLMTIVPLDRVW
jgi:multidrug resistance efflux pump